MSDPLSEFLRRNAPRPPAAGDDLEDRILRATLAPARAQSWWSERSPLLVAASLALVLLGTLGWQQQRLDSTLSPVELTALGLSEPTPFLAVDPETDLYDIRF